MEIVPFRIEMRVALPLYLKSAAADARCAAPRYVSLTRAVAPCLLTKTVGDTPCTQLQQPLRRSAENKTAILRAIKAGTF